MKVVEPPSLKQEAPLAHPTAIISPRAKIGPGVVVGPYAVIEAGVVIGARTIVEAHARIQGPTVIGCDNKIRAYSSIGCDPQDRKFSGGESRLVIGDHNDIREYTTLSRGTEEAGGVTKIGSHNLLMAYVHIAHDCVVGNHNTFANNSSLAGHVVVGDYVGLGGFSAAHQFCRIGSYAFSGGCSLITKDISPYTLVAGNPARLIGLNLEGLKRRQFPGEQVQRLKMIYRELFRQSTAIRDLATELLKDPDLSDHEQLLLDFVLTSERGLTR